MSHDTASAPSREDRLGFYLAPVLAAGARRFPVTPHKALIATASRNFEFSLRRSAEYAKRWSFDTNPSLRKALKERYFDPVHEAHARLGIGRRFQVVLGDDSGPSPSPTFHKARKADGSGLDVLLPLVRERHYGPIAEVTAGDIPFAEKAARVVWRGATTGVFWGREDKRSSRYHVYRNWDAIAANPRLDVAFSKIVQLHRTAFQAEHGDIARCVAEAMPIAGQLRYRYLLSLEGNDVATGLKWMLASNSLVLMPRPRVVSWACESLLQPNVHYVEVRDDLADLDAVIDWCDANPDICRQIVENSTRFIQPFMDDTAETELFDEVIRRYHRSVRLFNPDNQDDAAAEPGPA